MFNEEKIYLRSLYDSSLVENTRASNYLLLCIEFFDACARNRQSTARALDLSISLVESRCKNFEKDMEYARWPEGLPTRRDVMKDRFFSHDIIYVE